MDDQKQELVKKLAGANNILVTVSSNPSVDQLSAAIGLTLLLNKMKKHATAVFSGQIPSTIEFLKPEDTIEQTTDSLRDFIISLDKSKADKLRYKVEDNVVKIFITPYKTSINENDLDFSQGDFNVDVVLCLGVDKQQDLDQAITSHGRILHDATVAVVSTQQSAELGSLNWVNAQASSLSELAADLAGALDKKEIDGQIATAFLTGIVAETDRFSNDKTAPSTMQLSAELMAAGANQQLVASELEANHDSLLTGVAPHSDVSVGNDGTLEIGHVPDAEASEPPANPVEQPLPAEDPVDDSRQFLAGDAAPEMGDAKAEGESADEQAPASRLILQPPSMGGTLTANSVPEGFDPSVDPLTMLNRDDSPLLSHGGGATSSGPSAADAPQLAEEPTVPLPSVQEDAVNEPIINTPADPPAAPLPDLPEPPTMPAPPPSTVDTSPDPAVIAPAESSAPAASDGVPDFEPLPSEPLATPAAAVASAPPNFVPNPAFSAPPAAPPTADDQSLADLEAAVHSPHAGDQPAQPAADDSPTEDVDAARDAVMNAINAAPTAGPLPPTASVGAEGYLNVQDLPDSTVVASPTDMPVNAGMPPLTPEPTPLLDAAPVSASPADTPLNMPLPPSGFSMPAANNQPPTSAPVDASTAPPVPPPLPFNFDNPQK